MVNAQEWLDRKFPLESRKAITKLDARHKGLIGSLAIKDWPKLEWIRFQGNRLTNLIISNCPKIKILDFDHNQLTNLDFLNNLEKKTLNFLAIGNNNFPPQDLTIFSKFINLEIFYLANNAFYGSLEPLKNCSRLKEISIINTNIDSGLEYLPSSLEMIWCVRSPIMKEVECYHFYDVKDGYGNVCHDYQSWRKDNQLLVSKVKLLQIKDRQIKELLKEIASKQKELDNSNTNQEKIQKEKEKLEAKLTNLQIKYDELLREINIRQELLRSLVESKKELSELIISCNFNTDEEFIVKETLELQKDIILYDISSLGNQRYEMKERKVNYLEEKGFNQISKICLIQSEITQLEIQLDKTKNKFQFAVEGVKTFDNGKYISNTLSDLIILGDVNVEGNVLIGCELGNNNNLSYNINKLIELPSQEVQSHQLIPY